MKTFTIDAENNVTVHSSRKAAKETGNGTFATEVEFAGLIGPDSKRLVEIWNSLPGVKAVTKFANRKQATERIWKAIQNLGEGARVEAKPDAGVPEAVSAEVAPAESHEAPAIAPEANHDPAPDAAEEQVVRQAEIFPAADPTTSEPVADAGAPMADVAPVTESPTQKPTRAKKAGQASQKPKTEKQESGPREGSKTAQVVAMLKGEGGATISEIMSAMGWQKHTVRGFMAGTMKKAGYTVESFKPEGGERTYRIPK